MRTAPLFQMVDAVTVPVPSLDDGLAFYRDGLGHTLAWRNDATGQAGLHLPASETEIVLATALPHEANWRVDSVDEAVRAVRAAGGRAAVPVDIPVGRTVAVTDPFGNSLLLLDLSKGRYVTDRAGNVTGVRK